MKIVEPITKGKSVFFDPFGQKNRRFDEILFAPQFGEPRLKPRRIQATTDAAKPSDDERS